MVTMPGPGPQAPRPPLDGAAAKPFCIGLALVVAAEIPTKVFLQNPSGRTYAHTFTAAP